MRRATLQSSYTKGELDPDLSERQDLEHLYNSLARATNSIFRPQGGFSDRGGLELVSNADVLASGVERRLRRRIVPLPLTADNFTAANGGTTSLLVDQNTATVLQTNAVTTVEFEVVQIDLATAQRVDFVDVINFQAELAGADEVLFVEYWDGVRWRTFGDAVGVPVAKAIRMEARTRRFGTTPGGPGGSPIVARNWRIVIRDGVGLGQVSIGEIRFWRETTGLTPVRVREVARSKATNYQLVLTERNIDVFEGQRYVASIPVPVAFSQVAEVTFAGGFDTKIILHEMIETQRILRQGSSGEWNIAPAPFVNVPNMPESVVFTGDQDEIQSLDVSGLTAGNTFVLMLGDQLTRAITVADWPTMAADVAAALGALPGVTAGAANITVDVVDGPALQVQFTGANGDRAWPLISALVLDAQVSPRTTIVQEGRDAQGKFFSAQTGWPRCGSFVQQRMWVAGFRSAPTSYGFSVNPTIWSFANTGSPLTADKAFFGSLDVKKVEIINDVFVGRHLQMFTEAGEWYGETRTLDATQPINWVPASGHGMQRGVPLTFADGATLFVQQGGETLRDYLYGDAEASYGAEPLTVLAPHLLTNVVDVAHRQARTVRDGNLIVMVNADGTAAAVTLLRKQNVVAGAPWTTVGSFRSAMASIAHELYLVTERNGDYWLERRTADRPLDWATRSVGAARTVVTGAGYLEGRTDVWAIADDEVVGPLTVTGGQFILPKAAADVAFGLMPEWFVRGQEARDKLQNSQPFRGPGRIYEAELSLKTTGDIWLGTNGAAHRRVPLTRAGSRFKRGGPLQTTTGGDPTLPMMQRLYTGNVLVTGILGIDDHPFFELSRRLPAPVSVKAMRYEIAHRGDAMGGGGS